MHHPGVILVYETSKGRFRFLCDKFNSWQDNLRALALTLERLRGAAMYGALDEGQQYEGLRALPAAMDPDTRDRYFQAAERLRKLADMETGAQALLLDRENFRRARWLALARVHPDATGDTEAWHEVQADIDLLRRYHGMEEKDLR